MSVNIVGCSKKVSFQLFSELNWVSHGTQNFGQSLLLSMQTVLRTRTHIQRTVCAAAAACSRSTILNGDRILQSTKIAP